MPRGRKKSSEPKEEKMYLVVEEAEVIIGKLTDKYPDILWAVNPHSVITLGVENIEKPKNCSYLAKIHAITPLYKALLKKYDIKNQYIIELYWSDWNNWNLHTKQWILFHELLHIPGPDKNGLIKHNIQDFSLTIDIVGVDGYENNKIPDLLGDEPVKFRKELIPVNEEQLGENDAPTPPEQ